ncbi:unnamed protein product [Acanthosepion pharaonis]|uniref:Uncharacterized protein n=1 Tax=Acanthosepion pharaonis TaxID=158019 RepID=A0A812ASZ4_ACAPH|nr:unnamed protein product [Sepia pharaonis]
MHVTARSDDHESTDRGLSRLPSSVSLDRVLSLGGSPRVFFFSSSEVYDETYTVCCPLFPVYSAPRENKVGAYFLWSCSLPSDISDTQDCDFALDHKYNNLKYFVCQTTGVPSYNHSVTSWSLPVFLAESSLLFISLSLSLSLSIYLSIYLSISPSFSHVSLYTGCDG